MSHYDTNHDAVVSGDELNACPSLKRELQRYDADQDGRLTEQEISDRTAAFLRGSAGLLSFNCSLTLDGRALSGATVTFLPEKSLGSEVKPASGITDARGNVEPSLDRAALPQEYQDLRMMQPGLYTVQVTHPKIKLPKRYSTNSVLGCEVSGEAANPAFPVRFELKSR